MLRLEIPYRLPGMNNIINANRTVVKRGGKRFITGAWMKANIEEELKFLFLEQAHGVKFTEPVNIYIAFIEKDFRRDDDNVHAAEKYVMDALKKAEIIPDDSPKWCHVIPERFTAKGTFDERAAAEKVIVKIYPKDGSEMTVCMKEMGEK